MIFVGLFEGALSGSMVYYGGIVCLCMSIIAIVVCALVFPKQRKEVLKKMGDE